MKNLIIALLSAYIFHSQFCEVKIAWLTIPVLATIIFCILTEIDEAIENHKAIKRRKRGIL